MAQPQQPEWNIEFQRYLYTFRDEQYGRDYWKHYVEGEGWVFFDWVPVDWVPVPPIHRADSMIAATPSGAGPFGYGQTSNGRGEFIRGSYNPQYPQNPQLNTHVEQLDSSFYVRASSFFEEGRVFSVLFSENAGANALNPMADYNTNLSKVKYNEYVHTQVRRFIVTKRKREFCFAVPIFSYGNKGTTKRGVEPNEHAIAYSLGKDPQLVYGELPLVKAPIPIVMDQYADALAPASRIYFAIHHPIQYNVKVKSLGYVHPDYLPTFLGYWYQENHDSKQEFDITQNPNNTDTV
jgi:hypothetical protein